MSDVVGLALRDGQIDVVVLAGGMGGTTSAHGFGVPARRGPAGASAVRLQEAGVRAGTCGRSPRRTVGAKAVELPKVARCDLRQMVGFELERHLPFPPGEALFDFEILSARRASRLACCWWRSSGGPRAGAPDPEGRRPRAAVRRRRDSRLARLVEGPRGTGADRAVARRE